MKFKNLIKLVNEIFPGAEVIEEKQISPSEAGRILSNSKKTKDSKEKKIKKSQRVDKNQLSLI
jgi:hypothetical protein